MFQDAETPSATSSAPKAQVKVSQPDEVPFDTGLTAPAPQVQQVQTPVTPVAPTPTAPQAQPATSVDDELDALINGLSK